MAKRHRSKQVAAQQDAELERLLEDLEEEHGTPQPVLFAPPKRPRGSESGAAPAAKKKVKGPSEQTIASAVNVQGCPIGRSS